MIKHFVFRLLAFAALPTAILVVWTALVVSLDLKSYRSSLSVPADRDVWVCGDSQSRDSLDPRVFTRLRNFSCAASAPDQNLLRLKDLLAANPGRRGYVLLDTSLVQVGLDERNSPLSECGPERVHALLHFYHAFDGVRPFGSVVRLWRDVVLLRKFDELRKCLAKRRPYVCSFAGAFFSPPTAGFIEHPAKARKDLLRKAQTFNRAEPFAAGQRTADILRESADLVRRAGMTPVFVTTPVSPMLLADLDVSRVCALTNGVAAIAAECGAAYLNCLDVPIPVECWHDANHLNAEGAKLFSEMFSRDFANREAEL